MISRDNFQYSITLLKSLDFKSDFYGGEIVTGYTPKNDIIISEEQYKALINKEKVTILYHTLRDTLSTEIDIYMVDQISVMRTRTYISTDSAKFYL